nr:hypothetical protein [uncultured Carboxylicivirga sp.]
MKLKNIYSFFLMVLVLMVSSCDPIEDRDILSNSFNPDNIDLQVVQATNGGNKLSIQMNTPGVMGYWDYVIDKRYTDRVEVVFPFTGNHTFTYHVTTPYMSDGTPESKEYVEKSVSVEITQLDEALPQAYYYLIGEQLAGRTWVFDGGPEPDGRLWYFMSENDKPENHMSPWWNAAGDCCPPPDAAGRMVFDLEGGANYTYYAGPDAEPVHGGFAFNTDYTAITLTGANILGHFAQDGNQNGKDDGKYSIMLLSNDKLVIYNPKSAGYGTGWTWVFKPLD